jgi:glycosyl transferase family 28
VEEDGVAGTSWGDVVEDVAPDVVVYDTMLPADPEAEPDARRVYVMRKCKAERQEAILAHPFLATVDLGIIPHTRHEFGYELPADVARRSLFAGPIVRAGDPAAHAGLRERHGLDGARFVLVSSAGGGGFEATAGPFFAAVWAAHELLADRLPGLRHVVVLGPHRDAAPAALPGMSLVRAEPELASLFSLADLVVAEGGYNSVNEIRLAKAPAVFVPGDRRYDDQHERVQDLADRGLAVVATGGTEAVAAQIADVACSPLTLRSLRHRYEADRVPIGNERAARAILALAAAPAGDLGHPAGCVRA